MTFEAEQLGESGTELASLLRDLRKRVGLSGARLAARCNMSQSKVSRIENGRTRPSLVDVEQILRALDAPPGLVAEVSALARMANTEWRNLRELRRQGLGTRQAELKSLEASSTQMRYFLLSMVTGLLATPEYVRASLAHSTADTSRAVAGKLGRTASRPLRRLEAVHVRSDRAGGSLAGRFPTGTGRADGPAGVPVLPPERSDRRDPSRDTYAPNPSEYVHHLRRRWSPSRRQREVSYSATAEMSRRT